MPRSILRSRPFAAPRRQVLPNWRDSWFIPAVHPSTRSRFFLALWTAFVVLAVGFAFWLPAALRTGRFPVPLDDVYIHFAFARSAALGHPFEWSSGNGYSSGGTSLTYPLVLAPGWFVGFREEKLAWFAGLVACVSLWDLCRSIDKLIQPSSKVFLALVPLLVLSIPLADWSLYSGMETAFFAAVLGRFLVAAHRATIIEPSIRASAQWSAGFWGAFLVATRPEAAAIAGPIGISVVYAARSLGTIASLGRSLGPLTVFLGVQALANWAFTSELSQAGAVRKLVGTDPYLTPAQRSIEVLKNLIVLRTQAFDIAFGGSWVFLLVVGLALIAIFLCRSRLLVLPLVLGAVGMLLLVSLNTTARYQNFRYAVPSILAFILAAIFALAAISRKSRFGGVMALLLGLVLIGAPSKRFSKQIDHFVRSSANIEEQQATVARKLARHDPPFRRVFLGDAGALAYLSGLPALDGLGLGGYHDYPFARASVHGIPAVIELIERLPESERPDVLAIYPSWWADLVPRFGKELFTVHIDDNVICAAPDKVVYAADWSPLAISGETYPDAIDDIDIADLISERQHAYAFPRPQGGWVIGTALKDASGRIRYDAGRIIPQGRSETFTISKAIAPGPAKLVLRTDGDATIRLELSRNGQNLRDEERTIASSNDGAWTEVVFDVPDVTGGDEMKITAIVSAFRHHHAWIVRSGGSRGR